MPGTMQLSVLDLVDLPQPQASTSLFSMKVTMGKREYQSIGKHNFSFPVTSLLGNLTVMLHDSDGNEMLQTEFRTVSVVEKGILVDSFPLKGGGFIHMKLQFSLSQEERMRIHEMRETILKRKRGEEVKAGVKDSVSGKIYDKLMTNTITEGALHTQLEQIDPDHSESSGIPSLQVSDGHTKDSFEKGVTELIEANKEKLKTESPLDGTHEVQISSEEGLDPQSGSSTCLVSGKVNQFKSSLSAEMKEDQMQQTTISADEVQITSEEGLDPQSIISMSLISRKADQYNNSISADMKEDNIRSKVRKMISAFEDNRFQELQISGTRIKYSEHKVDMEGSLKRASSAENDISKAKVPQTIAKSFSAGMLSDTHPQQNLKFSRSAFTKKEEVEHRNPDRQQEAMVMGKGILLLEKYQKLTNLGSADEKVVEEPTGSEETMNSLKLSELVSEREGPIMSLKKNINTTKKNLDLDVISKDNYTLEENIEVGNSGATSMPSFHNEEELEAEFKPDPAKERYPNRAQADDDNGSFEQSVSNHPCSKTPYRQESSAGAVTKEDECFRSFSGEEIVCGNPNETGELVAYVINEGCPFQNLGIWTTRHVCITTGSRQLRDLAECCHNSRQSPAMEKKDTSMTPADDKIPHYDASTRDNENEKISSRTSGKSNHEKSVGISKLYEGLIEQGVRIAILVVACGTLFYNTRQKS